MAKFIFSGPLHLRLRSFGTINRIAIATYVRHLFGRKMAPDWDANTEIGIRFMRHQFTRAMAQSDMRKGRAILDSLLPITDDVYTVTKTPAKGGTWYVPQTLHSKATILYCHGGGYTFGGPVSERVAAMLAHRIGARLFYVDYRMTPEHPHPAQSEDALAAWEAISATTPPSEIVVLGDSAGGHMALMLLQTLKAKGLPQPALCLTLSAWTDIGALGESLHGNDPVDLVQGWMALQFGEWLDPDGRFGREALSPIRQDYAGLAQIYMQAGGRDILRDNTIIFAQEQQAKGADVTYDVWEGMPHNFQAYDTLHSASQEALAKLAATLRTHVDDAI